MLYEWLYPLRYAAPWLKWLNVLRYIPFRVLAAMLSAMFLSFLLSPWFIRELEKKQIGQVVRTDGPETHYKKSGTPTMGGALILLCVLLSTTLWCDLHNCIVLATTFVTVGYGLLGYTDDYRKIQKQNAKGIPAWGKLLAQIILCGVVLGFFFFAKNHVPQDWWVIRNQLSLPFVSFAKHPIWIPVWLYFLFAIFVVVGTSNAVNLTDGLDGLAIGPVIINAATYLVWAYLAGATLGIPHSEQRLVLARYLDIPAISSVGELAVYCGAVVGAGIGFLWYNTYPAQLFMGDVGSLALGGGLGMCTVFTKNEFLSILLGGIFVLETVSVIVQVISFRCTGKRILRMAPIHHHYEKIGWPEPKIIVRFWILSLLLAIVCLASLKLR